MSLEDAQLKMNEAVDWISNQLAGIVALKGAVQSNLIETIRVLHNGQMTPLQHIATVYGKGSQINIQPYQPDPQLLKAIEKAVTDAGFGAYVNSKTTVVASAPELSIEARQQTIVRINKLGEEAKVSVRTIRKNCKNNLKLPSEDEQKKVISSFTFSSLFNFSSVCFSLFLFVLFGLQYR